MNVTSDEHRDLLARVARDAMIEYGLEPEFPPTALAEVGTLADVSPDGTGAADLRGLLWCSIDNDDSLDLDQLTVAEGEVDAGTRILVAIADVSATVSTGSAIDAHAGVNTTSVYTPGRIFPMLPDRLSTDLTSLNPGEDRLAVVVGMTVDADGAVVAEDVRRALVRNHAKLAYPSVGAWLQDEGEMPAALAASRASPRTCGSSTPWRSAFARAATNRARSSSRPSRCALASTATPSADSPSSAATAPRSSSRTS
jgi:exoribonuclease-2